MTVSILLIKSSVIFDEPNRTIIEIIINYQAKIIQRTISTKSNIFIR
jgi:hypothetical protein